MRFTDIRPARLVKNEALHGVKSFNSGTEEKNMGWQDLEDIKQQLTPAEIGLRRQGGALEWDWDPLPSW